MTVVVHYSEGDKSSTVEVDDFDREDVVDDFISKFLTKINRSNGDFYIVYNSTQLEGSSTFEDQGIVGDSEDLYLFYHNTPA